jgi:hypothetical protein
MKTPPLITMLALLEFSMLGIGIGLLLMFPFLMITGEYNEGCQALAGGAASLHAPKLTLLIFLVFLI